jgi:type I restriction enzyme, R subunit
VMATGTGKTYTAFQIIWRLWKAKAKKRILFLADRNILVDQAKIKDFAPFKEAMTKIDKRTFEPAYQIFLALYQAITGKEESKKIYKKVSPDFFDLIVIDECHRGSASEDSQWREILDYFASATQIGLTATPKETETTSNSEYFGEPIFTYSLKQGIDDGFLANYKLIDVKLDIDVAGWTPDENQVDKKGQLIEQKHYTKKDFDRKIVIEERTQTVAKHISTYLKAIDPMMKTIVFCDDTEHASRMRQALINCNPEQYSKNDKYIMRITGDDDEGKKQLDQFINPKKEYPVIVTTSDLMTTGVDATTCKLIVLDKTIRSMTTFKQIIGRGTRIDEKYGKLWFTIMDFKGASALFADPDFDGEPVRIKTLTPEDLENETTFIDAIKDEVSEDGDADVPYVNDVPTVDEVKEPRRKYHVDGVAVEVTKERVKYFNEQGQSVTESVRDYSRKNARKQYASLDTFIQKWSAADKKQAIIEELQQSGILFTELQAEFGNDLDPFDLICHVAFDKPPLTRQQRAEQVKQNHDFSQYNDKAKQVLEQLLDKYADAGLQEMRSSKVLKLDPFKQMGLPVEITKYFGGPAQYWEAVNDLTMELYKVG